MYYLYTETSGNDPWYCLAKDNLRTTWGLALPLVLTQPLTQIITLNSFFGSTLLYSGPTLPTPTSNPELFL